VPTSGLVPAGITFNNTAASAVSPPVSYTCSLNRTTPLF